MTWAGRLPRSTHHAPRNRQEAPTSFAPATPASSAYSVVSHTVLGSGCDSRTSQAVLFGHRSDHVAGVHIAHSRRLGLCYEEPHFGRYSIQLVQRQPGACLSVSQAPKLFWAFSTDERMASLPIEFQRLPTLRSSFDCRSALSAMIAWGYVCDHSTLAGRNQGVYRRLTIRCTD